MIIIFSVITLAVGLITTLIGNVYFDGTFVFVNFDTPYKVLNTFQIFALLPIFLLLVLGVITLSMKKAKPFAIIYAIVVILAIIANIFFIATFIYNSSSIGISVNGVLVNESYISNIALQVVGNILLLVSAPLMVWKGLSNKKDKATHNKGIFTKQKSPKKIGSSLNSDFPTDDTTSSIEAGQSPQEFTSSPNESTFNIADKLAKLKEDINNNNFQEAFFEEGESESNDAPQHKEQPENFDDFRDAKNQAEKQNDEVKTEDVVLKENAFVNINKLDEISYNKGPVDPYKQTIVPRRSSTRASEFKKPIGNVANPQNAPKTERKTPRVDENYQGKVFLGDSDRIWEAMKNQKRRIKPQSQNNSSSSNSDVVSNLKQEKTKTMEIDIDKIKDPVNERTMTDSNPTIDWED